MPCEAARKDLHADHARIDDAVEMADRVILLAAPARIVKEVSLTEAERRNKSLLANLSREIADEMARLHSNDGNAEEQG